MTAELKPRRFGPITVRPEVHKGAPTGKWVMDIPAAVNNGRRARLFFDKCSEAEEYAKQAEELAGVRMAQAKKDRVEGIFPAPEKPKPTIRDLANHWLTTQEARVALEEVREVSFETDKYRLEPLLEYFGLMTADQITRSVVTQYHLKRLTRDRKPITGAKGRVRSSGNQKYSRRTVLGETALLRKILRLADQDNLIPGVKVIPGLKIPKTRVEPLSREEAVRLIQCMNRRRRLLIRFICETGCRKSEAFRLIWKNVDLTSGYVRICATEFGQIKNDHSDRQLPLGKGLVEALQRHREIALRQSSVIADRLVFPGATPDKPIDNVRKALAGAAKRAGILRNNKPMHVTLHMLRKSFATWLRMDGVALPVVQKKLGHSVGSTVTDEVYAYVTEEAQQRALVELDVPHA